MGVPGFFAWLQRKAASLKLKERLILDDIYDENIDWLLLDGNCFLHPQCFKVLAEVEGSGASTNKFALEDKMMEAAIEYLEKLVLTVDPKVGVYLAIDGVAPVAKMKQQRSRRFMSVHEKVIHDGIREKFGKEIKNIWSNSCITPGTSFMERLHNRILEWCEKTKQTTPDRVIIYSSCKSEGEGEHKLLNFIRENKEKGKVYQYVIYGLDADLIFLSLASGVPKIFLLRESLQLGRKSMESYEFAFVDMDVMKEFILKCTLNVIQQQSAKVAKADKEEKIKIAAQQRQEGKEEKEEDTGESVAVAEDSNANAWPLLREQIDNIVKDFIVLCFFIGNDFLPHLPAINVHTDGLSVLMSAYCSLLLEHEISQFIVNPDTFELNTNLFSKLIIKLSLGEHATLAQSFKQKQKKKKRWCQSSDPCDIAIFQIENLNFKIPDPIMLGKGTPDEYKHRYYNYHFGSIGSTSEQRQEWIDNLVKSYLVGVKWVSQYYFKGLCSWRWYYPFDYPPFIEDIRSFLEREGDSFSFEEIPFELEGPLPPVLQLISVLPPQSSYLVPRVFQDVMSNKLTQVGAMYPEEIQLDFIHADRFYQSIPQLPAINLPIMLAAYEANEQKLVGEEISRNQMMEKFVFM